MKLREFLALHEASKAGFVIALKSGKSEKPIKGYYVSDDEDVTQSIEKARVYKTMAIANGESHYLNDMWDLNPGEHFEAMAKDEVVKEAAEGKISSKELLAHVADKFDVDYKDEDGPALKKAIVAAHKAGCSGEKMSSSDLVGMAGDMGVDFDDEDGKAAKKAVLHAYKCTPDCCKGVKEAVELNERYGETALFDDDMDTILSGLERAVALLKSPNMRTHLKDTVDHMDVNASGEHTAALKSVIEATKAVKAFYNKMTTE